ncbi:hypothetical protein O6H91_04G061000 [Diphasiastrum complanatum]|uniref:Uncharacterized protein n=1 Tax=Diphasiastrum complanatum TaxID=34168 RepID=A0ACC2DXB9_DIPCM|nr:hypothetical protein O6H91_04G061000 [Diphasiastrum complanatum]
MGAPRGGRERHHQKERKSTQAAANGKFRRRKGRKDDEIEEIEALDSRIAAGAPQPGTNPLASVLEKEGAAEEGKDGTLRPYVGAKMFEQLPISDRTMRGLKDAKYTHMTAIQRAALPHALCGRDVLGAAKTGSGKTLAFLIPVVEKLFRLRWSNMDGVGALIISPTRELAVQIFDELKKVGKNHSLSGGLLIGGRKDVEAEKDRVNNLNILVCSPGRLLQHMDETPNFDCSQLQVLILDEADRILDMGFAGTLNAILAQIPKQRQTLLFSATQTRSVQDLARLSLKDPEYLAVHSESTVATPARLQQTAMIVPLDEKLDMLWSFIKTHLHAKTLVFLSSCKQVKFVHEAFKRLRPGVPIACLHGRMKQAQRLIVFYKFCEAKHSVLFATDVASRGLDFPTVDWVVQVDCPEDVASYIHRVGRTARYTAAGRSLLFLVPSEKNILAALEAARIPISTIKPNMSKIQRVSEALAGLLSKDPDLKYMAQRSFVTYLRSIHVRSDKSVFDVSKLPINEFALSLGLPTTPRIRFLKKGAGNLSQSSHQNVEHEVDESADDMEKDHGGERTNEDSSSDDPDSKADTGGNLKAGNKRSKLDRLFHRKNADVLSAAYDKMRSHEGGGSQATGAEEGAKDDDFLTRKRSTREAEPNEDANEIVSSRPLKDSRQPKKKKLKIDPNKGGNQRLVFDDEGNALPPLLALAKQKNLGGQSNSDIGKLFYLEVLSVIY